MAPWEGASKREWRMEMRVPARALKPLVVLAVAAASVGCISPAAYAEDTSVSVTSDSSNHVVVDVDLSACASDSGSDRQGAEKDGQVASGLKDSTGVDLPSLLNGLLAKPDTGIDPAESPAD